MTQETTWQDRVRAEASELSEKLAKLDAFQASEAFGQLPYYERDLLIAQRGHMANYLSVLQARIGLFPVPQDTGDQVPVTETNPVNSPALASAGEVKSADQLLTGLPTQSSIELLPTTGVNLVESA